jgi:2-methylisocitrate lyase-like PEP mutase family enzyme
MIDADDCYGDVKNVTRTIRGYEALGASSLFFEDQQSPKRCGHLKGSIYFQSSKFLKIAKNCFIGKRLVSTEAMVSKIRAALAARSEPDFFIIARTDAIEAYGLDEALRRGEKYLQTGADGLFIEGPRSIEDIERIGRHFKGASLCVNIFEGGGRTPWVSPDELHRMRFSMILYPTTILFRVTHAIERAAADLKAGKQLSKKDSVNFQTYEDIVGLPQWAEIEKKFHHEEQ